MVVNNLHLGWTGRGQTRHSSAARRNEVFDSQSAQGQATSELLDPVNGGEALLRPYFLFHGHKLGYRCPVFGDRDLLARLDLFQQFR